MPTIKLFLLSFLLTSSLCLNLDRPIAQETLPWSDPSIRDAVDINQIPEGTAENGQDVQTELNIYDDAPLDINCDDNTESFRLDATGTSRTPSPEMVNVDSFLCNGYVFTNSKVIRQTTPDLNSIIAHDPTLNSQHLGVTPIEDPTPIDDPTPVNPTLQTILDTLAIGLTP